MDEIIIEEKKYVSSKRAATITGYAKDYVGQLCREGRVEARLVGRNWYVLETALREHRFGADKETPEPEEVSAPVSRMSTWQKPRYAAEIPSLVPEVAPKPLVSLPQSPDSPAIADMQSAWKEWFEDKKPLATLPDGSEYFKDEYLPVVLPEVEDIEEDKIPRPDLDKSDVAEEKVALHRSYDSRETGEVIPPTSVPIVDLSARTRSKASDRQKPKQGEWNGVISSLLFLVACLAIFVALVGTGNSERLFAGTSLDFGFQKKVVDFLGGTSSYENTLK